MKTTYVKDFTKNQFIDEETFAIFESEKMEDKNGKPYYKLVLGDKTGTIQSKIWNDKLVNVDTKNLITGNILKVSGKVEEYKGSFQFNIQSATKIDEKVLDDYVSSSEYDADEMMKELREEITNIKDDEIKKILNKIFDDKAFESKFKYSVAASTIHHEFRSGLLQHVLEMITISKSMKRFYPNLNYDILTAGIIMHDIGKVEELDTTGVGTVYTKRGGLIGHIVLGVMIFERYGGHNLPENTFLHICHLILSHHGAIDMGSPVLPATVEALMLTFIDNLSSKTRSGLDQVSKIPEGREFGNPYLYLQNARFWTGGTSEVDSGLSLKDNQSPDSNLISNLDKSQEPNDLGQLVF